MRKREYLLLYLIGLVGLVSVSFSIRSPGYMDTEYYFAGGRQIFSGNGLVEPYIWNYFSGVEKLPASSFTYWMPLSSVIASAGMFLFDSEKFFAARFIFIVLAGFIPVLAAHIAFMFHPSRRAAWLAGLLAVFSGFYLPYFTIPESFVPVTLVGGLLFLFINKILSRETGNKKKLCLFLGIGILSGMMHLSRAEGVLWLAAACVIPFIGLDKKAISRSSIFQMLFTIILVLFGYLAVMSPWFIRNYLEFGSFFPPGNGKLIWATSYDDLFRFPPTLVTFKRFIQSGFGNILKDRLSALLLNLQSLIAVNGGIILFPLMLLGYWKNRWNKPISLFAIFSTVLLLIMSFVFPYAGARGGFFHSNAAVQCVFWALTPVGLEEIINWGIKKRGWKRDRAWKMFGAAIICTMVVISFFTLIDKINGTNDKQPWNMNEVTFARIDDQIKSLSGDSTSTVMVNDPPGYFVTTQRQAIVIPVADEDSFAALVKQFGVRFIVMDQNNSVRQREVLLNLLEQEKVKLLTELEGSQIYEFSGK